MNLKSKLRQKIQVLKVLGVKKLLLLPFAFVVVGALLILSKFMTVNVHHLKNHRIGHFATNSELSFLSAQEKKALSRQRQVDIFCLESTQSANYFFEKMWRRENFCIGKSWGWLILDLARRIKNSNFFLETTCIDTAGLLIKYPSATLHFLQEENNQGSQFLQDNGLSFDNQFVCLNVRDASFFSEAKPIGWHKNRDWSYHDYRDSDIKTYVAAAEALAEMGYTVFRMGAIVKEPLLSKHSKVIDYATNGMRTEFLDIFLGAHCKFAISTASGWDSVPTIFRRPLMFVNQLPVFSPSVDCLKLISFPKILQDAASGNILSLRDVIDRNIVSSHNSQAYKNTNTVIRDLSSEELVEAVTEMAQRVEGTFVETPEQKEMQAKLKHILSTHPKLQPTPNYYPIRAEFASCFLSRYPNFLD